MCLPHEEQSKSDVVTRIQKNYFREENKTKHVHNPMYDSTNNNNNNTITTTNGSTVLHAFNFTGMDGKTHTEK